MNILGISALYHDSAAALCIDGDIVAAAQEERFTRKKADQSIPENAIKYCLSKLDGALDAVIYYDNVLLTIDRWLKNGIAVQQDNPTMLAQSYGSIVGQKIWVKEKIFRHIPEQYVKNCSFYCCEHHLSHAASAFYPSPYKEAAIITIDGVGEWATTTIGIGTENKIKILKQINYPHSLGMLYSAFTYYCGFKVNTGEYKLMGLAPYGTPQFVSRIYEHLIDVKEDGSFLLNLDYFEYTRNDVMTGKKFETLFEGPRRTPEDRITQKYMDIAASVQQVANEIILKLAAYAKELTGCNNLVMAGGTALNCVSNGVVTDSGVFDNVWVQPAAGDAGGAVGAALYLEYQKTRRERKNCKADRMDGAFLGPCYDISQVEEFLQSGRYPYIKYKEDELYVRIAEMLKENKVIGIFQGQMEFGPRALGGRSIIANALEVDMQSRINLKIKFRESFRPFAPAVLKERMADYFEIDFESPYMLFVKKVLPSLRLITNQKETEDLTKIINQKRSRIPAVTHVDYSARIQTVDQERNPYFYRVIKEFEKMTGCAVVVNTSFNVRGEPIVCSLKDAYLCFMRTNMDALVIENCILQKEKQPELFHNKDWRKQYEPD